MTETYLHEVIKPDDILEVKLFDFKADNYERVIPPHWHASVEILYCIKGNLVIQTDNTSYSLVEGDVILLNSNVIHATNSPSKNHILVIQMPLSFMKKVTENQYNSQYVFQLNSASAIAEKGIIKALKQLLTYSKEDTIEGRLVTKIGIFQLILELIRHCQQTVNRKETLKTQENQLKLNEIVTFIKRNFQDMLSLKEIADYFNYSPTYFSKFFKKNMGTNYSDYLSLVRIEHAQNLLIHSEWTILDIALSSGFNNVRAFFNAFEKFHKMSPSTFRKNRK